MRDERRQHRPGDLEADPRELTVRDGLVAAITTPAIPPRCAGVGEAGSAVGRFERETQLLASLNRPNIAQVYGFEAITLPSGEGASFLTMELVPGEDLAQRLQREPLPLDEALHVARGMAEALEEAHERGIVHRDLKPANAI